VTVAIVTDSAAALPADVVDALRVTVVPMWLQLDGAARHEDEVDFDELIVHRDISTSGPTPGEFEAVLRDRVTDDGVCLLTISATMSSTYEAAVLGAELVGEELGAGRVRVVDTRTAAGAQGLVVIAAARAAARGATLDEVEAAACAAMNEVRLVACVPDLGYLVRSGRVPNIAGWAGRRLGLTPLFEFREAGAHPLRPARGMDNALERMVARCRRAHVDGHRLQVAVLHAHALDAATDLLSRVAKELDPSETFVASFGAVMVAHTGPGLVGLAWRWEPVAADDGADPSAG
jgi:DegV family protein with EDD domain